MKDLAEVKVTQSGGPPMWAVAAQWGMALVSYTCIFGFGGYYIGDHFMNSRLWALGLMMFGLVGGFSAAIIQIFRQSMAIDRSTPNRGKPLPDEPKEDPWAK